MENPLTNYEPWVSNPACTVSAAYRYFQVDPYRWDNPTLTPVYPTK
jgi:hypothetical protein